MHIGELAAASGLSRDTLRFYERRGLLPARRGANGYRTYARSHLAWLAQVKSAQQLGFSLREIAEAMPLLTHSTVPLDAEVARRLAAKLAELDERLAHLQALRNELVARITAPCPLRAAPPAP